jgi:hypothetical protein
MKNEIVQIDALDHFEKLFQWTNIYMLHANNITMSF